jgi:hypothetical protein
LSKSAQQHKCIMVTNYEDEKDNVLHSEQWHTKGTKKYSTHLLPRRTKSLSAQQPKGDRKFKC